MNRCRYALASVLWWLQCRPRLRWLLFLPYAGGRHIDWLPVRCTDCGWTGPLRWCFHTYAPVGDGDVEPSDECPQCGSDQLEMEP